MITFFTGHDYPYLFRKPYQFFSVTSVYSCFPTEPLTSFFLHFSPHLRGFSWVLVLLLEQLLFVVSSFLTYFGRTEGNKNTLRETNEILGVREKKNHLMWSDILGITKGLKALKAEKTEGFFIIYLLGIYLSKPVPFKRNLDRWTLLCGGSLLKIKLRIFSSSW